MAVLILPGAEAVLAAQAAALPQPDQLCGPFAARAALHAILDAPAVPSMISLAEASGTTIWPHDDPSSRPAGTTLDRTGWDQLPLAADPGASGTDAAGLAVGVGQAAHGAVTVVPSSGEGATTATLTTLLVSVARSQVPIGVLANVRTAALDPGTHWDVGHFVVLWALDRDASGGPRVAVADSYPELGAPDEPPGCRWVPVARLADALVAAPGRGLLLLVDADHTQAVTGLVVEAGLDPVIWST